MRKTFGSLVVPVTFLGLLLFCVGCEKPARRERRPGARVPRRGAVEKPVKDADVELFALEEWNVEEEAEAEEAPAEEEVEEEAEAEEAPAEEEVEGKDDGDW